MARFVLRFWIQSKLMSLKVIITLYPPHHQQMSNPCSALFQLWIWAMWDLAPIPFSKRHPTQRPFATFSWANALGLRPTCSLAPRKSFSFAQKSCPMHLNLFLFLWQGRKERTTEAGKVCIDLQHPEFDWHFKSELQQKQPVSACNVCGWTTAQMGWQFVRGKYKSEQKWLPKGLRIAKWLSRDGWDFYRWLRVKITLVQCKAP